MALLRTDVKICEYCIDTWQVNPVGRRAELDQAVNRIARHIQREDSYDLRQWWEAVLLKPAQRLALQARLLGGTHPHTQKVLRQTFEGFRTLYSEHRAWRREVLRGDLDERVSEHPLLRKSTVHTTLHRKHALEPKDFLHLDREGLQALYDQLILAKGFGALTDNTAVALLKAGVAQGLFLPRPSLKTYQRAMYLFYGWDVPRSPLEEWRILTSPQLVGSRRHLAKTWHPDTAGRDIPPLLQRHYWNLLRWTWAAIKTRRKQMLNRWNGHPLDTAFDLEHALESPREGQDLRWRETTDRGLSLPEVAGGSDE